MYKSLCTDGLGVSIPQNELIELALTFGYKGIEIDMDDMVGLSLIHISEPTRPY